MASPFLSALARSVKGSARKDGSCRAGPSRSNCFKTYVISGCAESWFGYNPRNSTVDAYGVTP